MHLWRSNLKQSLQDSPLRWSRIRSRRPGNVFITRFASKSQSVCICLDFRHTPKDGPGPARPCKAVGLALLLDVCSGFDGWPGHSGQPCVLVVGATLLVKSPTTEMTRPSNLELLSAGVACFMTWFSGRSESVVLGGNNGCDKGQILRVEMHKCWALSFLYFTEILLTW